MSKSDEFRESVKIILKQLCLICPHQDDKHEMNCLECCPLKQVSQNSSASPKQLQQSEIEMLVKRAKEIYEDGDDNKEAWAIVRDLTQLSDMQ